MRFEYVEILELLADLERRDLGDADKHIIRKTLMDVYASIKAREEDDWE